MLIRLTFKTPDVTDFVPLEVETALGVEHDEEEYEAELKKAMSCINQYVRWGELIRIEFNTNAQTARVVPN